MHPASRSSGLAPKSRPKKTEESGFKSDVAVFASFFQEGFEIRFGRVGDDKCGNRPFNGGINPNRPFVGLRVLLVQR